MARCSDCNKFVSLELGDSPDMNLDIDDEGNITGDVTITRNCAECGTEMKEGQVRGQPHDRRGGYPRADAPGRTGRQGQGPRRGGGCGDARGEAIPDEDDEEEFELTIEDEEGEATESGTSRKPMFGFLGMFTVKCSLCPDFEHNVETDDEMAGSDMDDMN